MLADPFQVTPANPQYYVLQSKPILLTTSAEHRGAVINTGFDYPAYFNALQPHGDGTCTLKTPAYKIDIALKIKRL